MILNSAPRIHGIVPISGGEMRAFLDLLLPCLPLPVILYNMPWLTGHSFDDATLRHALTFPELMDAFQRGDQQAAAEAQAQIARLGKAIFSLTGQPASVFATIKGGLAVLGLCEPAMLPPLTACLPEEVAALRLTLSEVSQAAACR
jgi:dihydrodipicolinate synthase/N-acetylneuraminate lyase